MLADQLTAMKKLEIVISGEHAGDVRDLLDEYVSGYTQIAPVSGRGHHGYHEGRLLFNDASAQAMIVSIVRPDALEPLLEGLLPLLERRSGVAWVSDVAVARAAYFEPQPDSR
jgi:nitrogen regulatory protein PII